MVRFVASVQQEKPMPLHNLKLPNYVEPPLRMPVASRYVGPTLAAMRRFGGYRLTVETDRNGNTSAWLERAVPRAIQAG
jgi:hypothetical protein